MSISLINYYIKEGLKNLGKNKKSAIGSLSIMCATLLVFGIFMLIIINTQELVKKLELEQGMQVFIIEKTEDSKIKEVGEKIKEIKEVNTATLKTSAEALEDIRVQFKDNPRNIRRDNPRLLTCNIYC